MAEFIDPTGHANYGIGLCARCSRKFPLDELSPDPNSPGLMVCDADRDEYDPYRLPARVTEDIHLPFTRPDVPLASGFDNPSASERGGPLLLSGVHGGTTETLIWSTPTVLFTEYRVYRSIDGGAYVRIATPTPLVNSMVDTGIDSSLHGYQWYATYLDVYGIESNPSNVVSVAYMPIASFAMVIGNSGNAYLSPDLEHWSTAAIGQASAWNAGAFSPTLGTQGRFVIVNNSGAGVATAYSDDGGESWVLSSDLPPSSSYQDIVWDSAHSVFCVCGANNGGVARIYVSANGINWTLSNAGARSDCAYNGAAYDDVHGTIVLVSNPPGGLDHNGVMVSIDGGATWTIQSFNDSGWGHPTEVQFTGTSLVACGPSSLTYMRSLDGGFTWGVGSGPFSSVFALTALPTDATYVRVRNGANAIDYSAVLNGPYTNVPQGNIWNDVRYDRLYGFNKFLAVSATKAGYGTDGVAWTNPAVFSFAGSQRVVFGTVPSVDPLSHDHFAISSDTTVGNVFVYSDAGPGGVAIPTGTSNRSWTGVAFSPTLGSGKGRLVMVSSSGVANAAGYSDDLGATWTFVPSADDTKVWTTVRWLPDLALFAAGANSAGSNNLMTSADGINWTSRNPGAGVRIHAITSDGLGKALVGGLVANPSNVLTTTDFVTYSGPFLNQNNRTVAFSNYLNGFFYSFGTQGDVWRSADGAAWVSQGTIGVAGNAGGSCGCWQNAAGVILVCSAANGLWSSTNGGVSWTQRIAASSIPDVKWSQDRGLFVASDNGAARYRTSPDGVVWTSRPLLAAQSWSGVEVLTGP